MTSLVLSFGVVLISSLTALYLFNKHRKGFLLSKLEKTSLVIGLVVDIAILVSLVIPNTPIISEAWGQIPIAAQQLILGVTIVIAIVLVITIWRKSRIVLDPRFKNLTIHYSSQKDTPSSPEPARPRYVTNNSTKQAYWVSDLIEPYIRQHKIKWYPYDNASTLHTHLKSQGFNINDFDPSDEQLGLFLFANGHLVVATDKLEPEILERLKKRMAEGKFKDYQVIFLFPWYCWFLRFSYIEARAWPPNRKILADYSSKKEAFAAPSECMALLHERILSSDACTPRPTEDIPKWCKRKKGLTYMHKNFTIEELLANHP